MEERIRFIKKQDDNSKKQHTHELQNTQITKQLDENILQQTAHPHITQPIYSNETTSAIVQYIIKLVLKRTDKYIQADQSAKVHFVDQTLKALINRENVVLSDQIYTPHVQSRLQCDKQPKTSSIFFEGTGQAKLYFEIKKKNLISSQMQPPPKLMNKSSHRSNKIIEAVKKAGKNKDDGKQENKKGQNKQKRSTEKSSNKQKITRIASIEDPKMNPHLIQLDSTKQYQQNNDNFINYLREIKKEGKVKQRKQSITMNKNDKMIEGLSTSLIKSTKEYLYQTKTKSICSQNSNMAKRDRLQKSNAFVLENFVCGVSEEKIGYNAYSYDKVDHKMSSQNSLKKKEKQMASNRKINNRISTKDTVEQKQNVYLPMIEEKKSPRRSSVKMLDQMSKWQSKQNFQNYKTKLGEYLNSGSILPSVIVRRATHGGEQKPKDLFDGVKQEMTQDKQRYIEHDIE